MKHLFLTSKALPLIAITFMLFSCSKSELSKPGPSQSSASAATVESIVTADTDSIVGRYKIARFIEDTKDETSRFNGYRFEFQSDSDFIARTNSGQIVEGTWTLDSTGTVLNINIPGTGALDKLVGDWRIASLTGTRMVLINAEGDRVVFTRLRS